MVTMLEEHQYSDEAMARILSIPIPEVNMHKDGLPILRSPVSSKTNMSSTSDIDLEWSPQAPTTFPPQMSAPSDIPVRMRAQSPALKALDEEYNKTDHPHLNGNRFVAPQETLDEGPEARNKQTVQEAFSILEQSVNDRMPYVQLASRRLQAVTESCNEEPFTLPTMNRSHLSPAIQALYSSPNGTRLIENPDTCKIGKSSTTSPTLIRNGNGFARRITVDNGRKDSGFGLMSPISPIFASGSQVDEVTGAGLREWLLSHGKMNGSMKKRVCKSISFHDFTPEKKTGRFSNILLAHYAVGSSNERVDVYEVDLPIMETNPYTGEERISAEKWIWFLIQRPLLSTSELDTTTKPIPSSSGFSPPSTSSNLSTPYHTPKTVNSPAPSLLSSKKAHTRTAPPNFPHPIPNTWVVFACPSSNITSYPDTIESTTTPLPESKSFMNKRGRPNYPFLKNVSTKEPKQIHKRKDYDFSHQGIPLFEFSTPSFSPSPPSAASLSPPTTSSGTSSQEKPPQFLSIETIGPYYPSLDLYHAHPNYSYLLTQHEFETRDFQSYNKEQAKQELAEGRDRIEELPSPYTGQWWKIFYERMWSDKNRWIKIKGCMGRGMCRVVVRWVEIEEDGSINGGGREEMDVDFEAECEKEASIGLGIGGLGGMRSIRCTASSSNLQPLNRTTRSETRRRSQLGSNGMCTNVGNQGTNGLTMAASIGRPVGVGILQSRDIKARLLAGDGGKVVKRKR